METERIALSQRERDRLRVLHEVQQKQITQIEAARRLKISDRHIRRLLFRLRECGDRAVVHGLRGRPSNRRFAARLELKILRRVRQRYADFGPTLAAEHLAQEGLPPRDAAQVDGAGQLVAPARATHKDHPCVAGAAILFR
jgi:predicted ArsR family transcriptional regulator